MSQDIHTFLDTILGKPETEVIEFKLASANYDTGDICEYVSALANEANLKQKEKSYLIFWVEPKKHQVVGTDYREDSTRLDSTKQQIFQNTKHSVNVYAVEHSGKRLVIFEIPPSPQGIVIESNGFAYAREWESLVALSRTKRDQIESQKSTDWSVQVILEATIEDLSKEALEKARSLYKGKNRKIADEVDAWNDETFLNKAKLTIKWKITQTAILLLWKPESNHYLTPGTSKISWILKDKDNNPKDYEHFTCPLILSVNEIYWKIRNLKYRYMSGDTLFPEEVDQYDPYIIREALNNCIAHQDYTLGWKIVIVENEDWSLVFTNSWSFIPKTVENVISANAPESIYRNKFLADAMVNLSLIDTIGSGIQRMFDIQKKKFFPLPEYDFSDNKVKLTITGKVLEINYARKLAQMPSLTLDEIIVLDKIQKGKINELKKIWVDSLRKKGLIEGRYPNVYISWEVSNIANQKAKYIRNRPMNNDFYAQKIVEYIKQYKTINKKDLRDLLYPMFPEHLSDTQKENKLNNLIPKIKEPPYNIIKYWWNTQTAKWKLNGN